MLMTFTFETTEDGSLTLRVDSGHDASASETPKGVAGEARLSEAMHSLKGAFSETVYIYGTAIETCLTKGFAPRVLSLGLGMGYVEILACALFLKKAHELQEGPERASFLAATGGESFELLEPLRRWFVNWLFGETSEEKLPADFRTAYDGILSRTAEHAGVSASEIRAHLAELVSDGRWRIRGALAADTDLGSAGRTPDGAGGFGCICFDAFSSKTSPELWNEEFLKAFFAKACASQCVLSTYACTGMLKRALKASGFEVTIREGFSSKRDSTFAVRA